MKFCIARVLPYKPVTVVPAHTHPASFLHRPCRTERKNWVQTFSHKPELVSLLTISHSLSILTSSDLVWFSDFASCLSPLPGRSMKAKIFLVSLTTISPETCLAYSRHFISTWCMHERAKAFIYWELIPCQALYCTYTSNIRCYSHNTPMKKVLLFIPILERRNLNFWGIKTYAQGYMGSKKQSWDRNP